MANTYYTHTTYPATNASGSSSAMRAELDAVMAGFALLPNALGLGQQGFSGGSWTNPTMQGGTYTNGALTGGTIDGAVIGGTTRAAASFTTLAANGAVALTAGGSLGGAYTASGGATFSGFAITGGTLDAAPVGSVTPASGAFTTLTTSAAATLGGALTVNGSGIDVGSTTGAQTTPINFHTSGHAITYDARIVASGGTTSVGAGTLTYTAAVHAFNTRPTFNSQTPWDTGNLPNPFSTTGGAVTGFTTFSGGVSFTARPSFNGAVPWDNVNLPNPFSTTGGTITGNTTISGALTVSSTASFTSRPNFNGATPWDSSNLPSPAQTTGATFTGQLLLPNGNATVPALSFSSDGSHDTGIYWGGDGIIAFTCNGNWQGTIQPGNWVLNGALYVNNALYQNDGNISGTAWGGYLSTWLGNNKANKNAGANTNGVQTETGPVIHPSTSAVDAGSPWVVCGLRNSAWVGPSGDCVGSLYLRLTQVIQT